MFYNKHLFSNEKKTEKLLKLTLLNQLIQLSRAATNAVQILWNLKESKLGHQGAFLSPSVPEHKLTPTRISNDWNWKKSN